MSEIDGHLLRRRAGARIAGEGGIALVATLLVVVLIAAVVAAAVNAAMSVTRSANADYYSTRAFYAAEAGAEHALAQVELALQDGFLSDGELADIAPPPLEGFDFTEFVVVKDGTWDLYAITQNIIVTSRATDLTGAHSGVVVGAQAQAIPLFQFAAFGNGSMEAWTGSRADTYGRMHVNGDVFMATNDTHFHDVLTTPGRFIRDGRVSHKDKGLIHFYMEDADGNDVEVNWDSEDTPDPEQFENKSNTRVAGHLRTGAMGVDSLVPPLPSGIEPRELIRPREGSDTEAERASKFAWQADMYVTIDLNDLRDKNVVCGGSPFPGSPPQLPTITIERPEGGVIPDDPTKCKIFQFNWEQFYDYHELFWVDVANVNMDEITNWILGPGDSTKVIYVEVVPRAGSPVAQTDNSGNGYFPVLRLRRGNQLHGPLTIGSELPLYVMGDYNKDNKQPAAIFGDRLTALSDNFPDGKVYMPGAKDTEMFFSIITGEGEGYMGCYHENPEPGCTDVPADHSPGVTVQMLEDWRACGGRCLHRMIGSFVTFWAPQIASPWGYFPGSVQSYKAPQRDWSFDTDLVDPRNLPPATPNVGYVLRASFREVY
jgi:hypothetical protein